MKKRKVFEGGINHRFDNELKKSAFEEEEKEIDKINLNKKRSFFGVNLTEKEEIYLDKLKERYQLTRGGVFHIIFSEYMRNHPL